MEQVSPWVIPTSDVTDWAKTITNLGRTEATGVVTGAWQ